MLSPESCAEHGKFYTERAEYQRGIMNAISDPLITRIVIMASARIGKTECLNNAMGYYIDQDPSPMLVVHPTGEMGKAWSRDYLAPMIRDTPCLLKKVRDPKSRDSGNTIMTKTFKGGILDVAISGSPASLSGRTKRIIFCIDADRFVPSAGAEGDPVGLAFKRATTFWNKKEIIESTPTIKGWSRIEKAYEASDMKKFYVPCTHCNEFQILKWAQVKWPKDKKGKSMPEEAWYECESCRGVITDADKIQMIRRGEWRAEKELKGVAGFWLNEIYSPWVSFGNMVARFLEAKNDPEQLKVFINTALAETWDEGGETVDDNTLFGRKEQYGPELPANVVLLTAGVDVQGNRIEVKIVGHGVGEETWRMEYKVLTGDPVRQQVWTDLDEYLMTLWKHKLGVSLPISGVCIDTGYLNHQVYAFVRPRQTRRVFGFLQRVFAVKGSNEPMKPFLNKPIFNKIGKVFLYMIGTNTAKDTIHGRLKIDKHGPGYMHFPLEFDEEYFKQLTAEVRRVKKGVRIWEAKPGAKVEALDNEVYAMAARGLLNANLEKLAERLQERVKEYKEKAMVEGTEPGSEVNPRVPVPRKKGRRVIHPGRLGNNENM